MRALVIGRSGQVARCLALHDDLAAVTCIGRDRLDLNHLTGLEAILQGERPDIVINAAAYTAVDRAEDEPHLAMQVNAEAPGTLAEAAKAIGARFIHLSTDYVFDGTAERPYRESDPVSPLGVYGATKLRGEEAVAESGADAIIVRTAWVYSPFGGNFVKTMLRLARDRDEVSVVADQIGSPTSASDLAAAIWRIASHWDSAIANAPRRIIHAAGTGQASWADVAAAVFVESAKLGGPVARVRPITTSQYPTRAARPAWSVLSNEMLARATGHRMPEWRASLAPVVAQLLECDG